MRFLTASQGHDQYHESCRFGGGSPPHIRIPGGVWDSRHPRRALAPASVGSPRQHFPLDVPARGIPWCRVLAARGAPTYFLPPVPSFSPTKQSKEPWRRCGPGSRNPVTQLNYFGTAVCRAGTTVPAEPQRPRRVCSWCAIRQQLGYPQGLGWQGISHGRTSTGLLFPRGQPP